MAQQSLTSVLGPAKFNLWYETIIDYVIAAPEMTQGQIAAKLGRSQPWVSLVMNSDSFKARYAKRREEHSRRISEGVENRLHGVATQALDRLAETLKKKDLTPGFTLDATDVLLTRLGYTPKGRRDAEGGIVGGVGLSGPPNNVVVQVFQPVPAATLSRAQSDIRSLEATKLVAPEESPKAAGPVSIRASIEEAQIIDEIPEEENDTSIREETPA